MTRVTSTQPLAGALRCRTPAMHGLRRLTSIEAFALALVEASAGLEGAAPATANESAAHDDGAPAAE